MFSHIVIAWDDSNAARHAAAYALALAERFGSRIDVASVPAIEESPDTIARRDAFCRDAARAGVKARVVLAPVDVKPDVAIVDHARACGADLIVIGHRTLDPLSRSILGSTSERVLRHAVCPVLAVTGSD